MRRRVAAALALLVLVWLPTVTPPPVARAATVCSGWSNMLVPPPTIRVLRSTGPAAGTVQTVDFKSYVKTVMAAEYPSSWASETLKAGAVAVKEYAWYFTMHYRGGTATGGCYDVVDTTTDQVYNPEQRTPATSLVNAVEASWGYVALKSGDVFVTGYRAGSSVACGTDADGTHLFQNSSQDCGAKGKKMAEILGIYYAGIVVSGPLSAPIATFFTAPAGTLVTAGASAALAWFEEPTAGATIASRSLTLVSAKAFGGACSSLWQPARPPWSTTAASPQTIAGLRAGFCYRVLMTLRDSSGATASLSSGSFLDDPLAPVGTFTNPPATRTTATTGGAVSVSWTESPAAGTTIASRTLVQEYAPAPRATSCAGATWKTAWSVAASSPYAVSGMARAGCYRYRLTLTDSTGRRGTWSSGEFLTPVSF